MTDKNIEPASPRAYAVLFLNMHASYYYTMHRKTGRPSPNINHSVKKTKRLLRHVISYIDLTASIKKYEAPNVVPGLTGVSRQATG